MQIMGIEYTTHEVFNLIFFLILIITLPAGLIKQFYLAVKTGQEDIPPASININNKKTNQKRKKIKSR